MTYQEAIKLLRHHQEWRLGADILMIEPKDLTEAIDAILTNYNENKKDEDDGRLSNFGISFLAD